MKRRWIIFAVVIIGLLIIIYGSFAIFLGQGPGGSGFAQNRIALIRIEGVISDSDLSGPFGVTGTEPETIIEQLRHADRDPAIQAIMLRINSPGGTVAASQEIYREMMRVHKPVVASVGDVGASGAYYVASACDRIMAAPSSAVGSIGVILEAPNYGELLKKIGVEYTVITSGQHKDIGNPTRKMTAEEYQILQSQSDLAYKQFVKDVAKGRKVSVAKVEEWANGLVYPGEEAKNMGLIDDIGNYRDAIDLTGKLGKIVGEPEVIEYNEPTVLELLTRAWQGQTQNINLGFASDLIQILLRRNQFQTY